MLGRVRHLALPPVSALIGGGAVLLLAALCLWSRGGQATDVRLVVSGDRVSAFVDGRPVLAGTFPAAPSGGLVVVLMPANRMPSLPSPNGIDTLTIRSADGSILFRDEFSRPPAETPWQVVSGKVRQDAGTWEADGVPTRLVLVQELHDYTLDMRVRNMTEVEVGVRATAPASGVFLGLRPFRLHDMSLSLREDNRVRIIETTDRVEMDKAGTLRGIAAMALRPLPFAAGGLAAALALVVLSARPASQLASLAARTPSIAWKLLPSPAGFALALAVCAIVAAAYLLRVPAEGVPHVPDELSYIFQAKVLASGHFAAPPPPAEPMFRWSNPAPILLHEGRWASMYPPVHPLMLAIGVAFDAMWLVPPLIGGGAVLLAFLLGRRAYGELEGLLAAVFFAVSPFFLMTASNFMSHNTTAFFLLAALYCLALGQRRSLLLMAAAGFGIGAVFGARPLTGLAVIPPIAIFLPLRLPEPGARVAAVREGVSLAAGGLAALLLYLGYQYAITGDPLHVEGTQGGSDAFGFGGAHSLAIGLTNEQTQLAHLLLVMHNWTPAIGLLLPFVPFTLGSRNRWDWLLLGCTVSMMAAYTLYKVDALMHGPRYWYETLPLLMLLSARGITITAARLCQWGNAVLAHLRWDARVSPGLALALLAMPFLALALRGGGKWMFSDDQPWLAEFVPNRANALRGFNGIDADLIHTLKAARLKDALVLVDDCGSWHCYGQAFDLNKPTLDGDAVYARYLPDRPDLLRELFAAYPDRLVYRANYHQASLKPFTLDGQGGAQPLRASEFVVAIPREIEDAPAARAPGTPEDRDRQRLDDLRAIAHLLEQHRAARGTFPEARNPQTLCYYPNDAGCALRAFGDIPRDPRPDRSYTYWSDGATYIVVARLEAAATSACDATLPAGLSQPGPLACVTPPSPR